MGERDEELDVEKVDNCGCVTTYRVREAEHPEDPDCDMKCDCGCACGMIWCLTTNDEDTELPKDPDY